MQKKHNTYIPVLAPGGAALLLGIIAAPLLKGYVTQTTIIWIVCSWLTIFVAFIVCAHIWKKSGFALRSWVYLGCIIAGIVQMAPYDDVCERFTPGGGCLSGVVAGAPLWQESTFVYNEITNEFTSFTLADVYAEDAHTIQYFPRIRCTIVASEKIPFARGDIISVTARWERIAAATNPGEFDQASYFAQQGIYVKAIANEGFLHWYTPRLSVWTQLRRALDTAREKWAHAFDVSEKYTRESALLSRMILGIRNELSPEISDTLARTGTFHIVAISGLHIGVIGGVLWCITWLMGVPRRYRGLFILPLLWLYACMVGLRPSVVRAMTMITALAIAPLVNRKRNVAHTLLATACIYLLLFPRQLTAFGTQLTFLCVAALLVAAPLVSEMMNRVRWLRLPEQYDLEHKSSLWVVHVRRYILHIISGTCAIWIVTWPLIVQQNNLITPGTWLANIIAVPAMTIILVCGCFTVVSFALIPWVSYVFAYVTLFLMHLLLDYVTWISAIPGAHFALRSLTPMAVFWYYAALSLTAVSLTYTYLRPHASAAGRRMFFLVTSLAWIVWLSVNMHDATKNDALHITTLDVGLGDACVIHTPQGHTVVIDAGVRFGDWSMGNRVVVPFLHAAGINRIDALICSHFDNDHCGGMPAVLERMRVENLYAPPQLAPDPAADELRNVSRAHKCAWNVTTAGDILIFGALTGRVIHPPTVITQWPEDAAAHGDNTWSLVIMWEWKGIRFITTGDATIASEALQIDAEKDLHAAILKVGHHGSATSSSRRYLRAVAPYAALVSVGQNGMGLPAPHVLKAIEDTGADIYRTDRTGAIDMRLKPRSIDVYTFNTRERTKK